VSRSRNICCHRETIRITYSECVCSFNNPAYNEHVPYYTVICGLLDNLIYPHYLTIFDKKKVLKINNVLIYSKNAVPKISHYKKNSTRCYRKCTQIFLQSTRYSRRILRKLEVSRYIFFEKHSNIKSNPSRGSRVVSCGRTDGHDEANRCFSKFYESA
jgi:hypothetical protein